MADSSSSEDSSEEDVEVAKTGKTAKVCLSCMLSGGVSALLMLLCFALKGQFSSC